MRDNALSKRRYNNLSKKETRSCKSVVSQDKICEIERILETEKIKAQAYSLEQLGYKNGLKYSGRKIKKAIETIKYQKCIAC